MIVRQTTQFLWLLPDAASSARFGHLIGDLSARVGAAPFEPHVTLLGSLCAEAADLIEHTRALARLIAPFRIAVERPDHSDAYFQCVFLVTALDGELIAARAEAERTFGCAPNSTPFFPHLSLVYGTFDPVIRQQLVESAACELPTHCAVDRLQLVEGAPDYRDWRTIETFALSGTRNPCSQSGRA
ncbi:2'-5' RNA ligase family protein [Methylotetracoccus oryzae]|uniref:2'-5' RNA ligase family protein n=1 Tax=Methylotetracoccus oryzae TaxID=1919059 RepID=UPI00111870C5|nr:2'-5' RNA ligase family protein [Methylotetracoccus oryzae]